MSGQLGSGAPSTAAIHQVVQGALKLPGQVSTSTQPAAPAQPAAKVAPEPQVQQTVEQRAVEVQNMSQAAADARNAVGIELPNFEDAPPADNTPPADGAPADAVPDDEADLPTDPAAENFKKLRGIVKTERQAKRELEEAKRIAEEELEAFRKGEKIPDIVQAKDRRIAELEPYEKVLNLKMSPEYQAKFVEPAISLKSELHKLGNDYGIPPQVMEQFVGIENKKDLNLALSRHFDDVGGLEVKRVIGELQQLGTQAIEAEQNAGESLQQLRAEFQTKELERAKQQTKVFEVTARNAWNAALEKTANEKVFKELILHPTDTHFNKTVVEPAQAQAAVQFGALIKKLAENGLKQLPEDVAAGMARMVILSIGSALAANGKIKAETRANQITQHAHRVTPYIRPNMGGNNGAAHDNKANQNRGPASVQEAAKQAGSFFTSR